MGDRGGARGRDKSVTLAR